MLTPRAAGRSREHGGRVLRARTCARLAFMLFYTSTAHALAQPSAASEPSTSDTAQAVGPGAAALRGLVNTGVPLGTPEITLRANTGYGVIERLSRSPGAQHRLLGGLAVGVAPLPWLSFALRLDGRLELLGDDGMGAHVIGFGDPRLYARAGHALRPDLWIGAQLGAFFPGRSAPSFVLAATTLDLEGQLVYHLDPRWTFLGSLGGRFDNSDQAAPDPARLRIGDRIALGLSSSHAILVALGAAYRLEPRVSVFGELSGQLLVGSRAPTFTDSPLRVAAGGRYTLSRALQAEVTTIVSLSSRPSTRVSSPWVPIEPRVTVLLALAYTLPLGAAAAPPAPPVEPTTAKPAEPPPPTVAAISGKISDERGEPLPDAKVVLHAAGATRELRTDGNGSYTFSDVPLGAAEIEVRAVGFAPQRWTLDVTAGMPPSAAMSLHPSENAGVLRGLIRSFDSTPLKATVIIRNARGKTVQNLESGDDGQIELELPPGRYSVTIEAAGHRRLTRDVQIKVNGVSVLNADMRKRP
ncbi:MAG: carboxypeptidase regulatory-like domain-containing protein [Polyangiales bacterium]